MAAGVEDGLGTVCWWGLSPALDLRQHLPPDPDPEAEAAVLLVGAAEGRHLLLTVSRARRGPPRTTTLFVAEQRPEAVARQLLFLLLALEAPGRSGPAARAAALLELLGSVRLRAATAALLTGAAGRLRRWITGDRYREGPADLGLMKCRERDALETVLRRWERPEPVPESRDWDRRLRRRLGTRYEARAAVADWELRMGLHPRGATTVSPGEFGLWRESGVAFVPRGGGDVPNPTLQSGRLPRADGQPGPDLGYWGDTVTGPFLAFGFATDQRRSPGKTATEISLANVTAMLHELLTGTPPEEPPGDRDPPGDWDPPTDGDPPEDQDPPCDDTSPLGPLVSLPVRIRFLPLGSARRPPPPRPPGGALPALAAGLEVAAGADPRTGATGGPRGHPPGGAAHVRAHPAAAPARRFSGAGGGAGPGERF
ncbi:dynein axonemal assembly factor 3 [Haliaeetus albicilla]|uniref:dynein axonemal assembly factor 3 n=1 Tax=Haliaeetus albicilla TaxID=8969 RepID=UPI0037E76FE5